MERTSIRGVLRYSEGRQTSDEFEDACCPPLSSICCMKRLKEGRIVERLVLISGITLGVSLGLFDWDSHLSMRKWAFLRGATSIEVMLDSIG